jgi:hypothetical protein
MGVSPVNCQETTSSLPVLPLAPVTRIIGSVGCMFRN